MPSEEATRPLRAWLLLGAILAIYEALLAVAVRLPRPADAWATWLAPNAWLLAASALLARRSEGRLFSPGQKRWIGIIPSTLLLAALLVATATRPAEAEPCESLQVLILVLIVPLAEEIYFRGILFEHLRRLWGGVPAILLATILFVLLHAGQGARAALGVAALSLVCGAITLICSTPRWAVAVHATWNALALVLAPLCLRDRWTATLCAATTIVLVLILGRAGRRVGSR
jgi:membrane protease YdiL (CAAX protease family)